MTPERWQRVQELLDRALNLAPDDVPAFLATACAGDEPLKREVERLFLACQQAESFLTDPPVHLISALLDDERVAEQRIGPYTLIREIGRGGMGAVYLAERTDVQKRVALKLVSGGLRSPGRVQRFLLERRMLARLEHPHIARLLDAGVTTGGTPWLAMEYVEGERIDRWCDNRKLDVRARLTLFEQVCSAVAYAHRNLIVHRDIKPANLLVTADGEARLLDFGIARLLAETGDADEPLTVDAGPMTPEYASPEQLRGDSVTTASDVFQLGRLLQLLLTGAEQSSAAHRRRRRGSDHDLDTVVGMATHPQADRRYAGAQQLLDDLRRYLDGHPVIARAPTLRYRTVRFVARHRAGTAMVTTVVALALGFAALTLVQNRRVMQERDRAEQVSHLLTDLFASSDPTVTAGDTMTVRAVLERGVSRIRSDVQLDPLVRARLLRVIAVASRNLGALERGMELLAEAVATLDDAVPSDHPALLESRRILGTWKAEAGEPVEAARLLDAVLELERKQGRQARMELAEAMHARAWAYQLGSRSEAARPLYEEALAMFRGLPVDSASSMDATMSNLATLAQEDDDLELADSLFRDVLERRRARLGGEHPLTARSLAGLAGTLLRRGQLDEAEHLVDQALDIRRRVLPSPHAELAGSLALKASLLSARGRPVDAEPYLREALAMNRALHGEGHTTVARGLADLGSIVRQLGRLDEAAALQREAAHRYIAAQGERTVATAIALTNLAWTEYLRQRFDEAETIYRRALPVLDSVWAGDFRLSSLLADYAYVLAARRNCAQAEPQARRAFALARNRWPAGSGDVLRPQRLLGQCLVVLQRYAEAEPILLDAHDRLVADWGTTSPFTIGARQDLVRLYERWGKPWEAERHRAAPVATPDTTAAS